MTTRGSQLDLDLGKEPGTELEGTSFAPAPAPSRAPAQSSNPNSCSEADIFGDSADSELHDHDDESRREEYETEEPHVLTVSDLNGFVREILEGQFPQIWIRGEISNFKPHTSGHYYFSLKDDAAQVSAVMFKGLNSKLKFKPTNGMEVLVRGKITVYEPRGSYQVFCETMEPVGAGALQKAFEQLKAKLQAEGLFDAKRKRAIPAFPKTIAIVTSPTGAAIKDILNVLRRRYRAARVIVVPALVQGEGAAASVVKGIQAANRITKPAPDVLIVGRGGGSIEDMWCFNEEVVARAIVASKIPVISAVGHEIDFTIADFVADLRAPTPSAAAELVAKNASDVLEKIQGLKARLWQAHKHRVRNLFEKLNSLGKRLVHPERRLQDLALKCDDLTTRLEAATFRYLESRRMHVRLALKRIGSPAELLRRLERRLHVAQVEIRARTRKILDRKTARVTEMMGRLDAMSPLRVVERGYSIVSHKGHVVTDAGKLKQGDRVELRFAKGKATAAIETLELKS